MDSQPSPPSNNTSTHRRPTPDDSPIHKRVRICSEAQELAQYISEQDEGLGLGLGIRLSLTPPEEERRSSPGQEANRSQPSNPGQETTRPPPPNPWAIQLLPPSPFWLDASPRIEQSGPALSSAASTVEQSGPTSSAAAQNASSQSATQPMQTSSQSTPSTGHSNRPASPALPSDATSQALGSGSASQALGSGSASRALGSGPASQALGSGSSVQSQSDSDSPAARFSSAPFATQSCPTSPADQASTASPALQSNPTLSAAPSDQISSAAPSNQIPSAAPSNTTPSAVQVVRNNPASQSVQSESDPAGPLVTTAETETSRLTALERPRELDENDTNRSAAIRDQALQNPRVFLYNQHTRQTRDTWLHEEGWMNAILSASVPGESPRMIRGRQIEAIWKEQMLNSLDLALLRGVCQKVRWAIRRRWPAEGLDVTVFGSCFAGLGSISSNLDLAIIDPRRPYGRDQEPQMLPEWYNVNTLADTFRADRDYQGVEAIAAAIPSVRFSVSCRGCRLPIVNVALYVNHLSGLANSALLCCYTDLRPRTFPPLFWAVKEFFKAHDLHGPSHIGDDTDSTQFSSYAIALLVIQFLQVIRRLPNLQDVGLLQRVPSHIRSIVKEVSEPRKLTCREANTGIQTPLRDITWDTTFFDPHQTGPLAEHHEVVEQDGYRALLPRRSVGAANRVPLPLAVWCDSWSTVSYRSEHLATPHPDSIGLHAHDQVGPSEVHQQIGSLFEEFLIWVHSVIYGSQRFWIDVAFGGEPFRASTNSFQAEWRGRTMCRGAGIDLVPLEWKQHLAIIADPFIKHRNVASNVTQATLVRLMLAIQSAERALRSPGRISSFLDLLKYHSEGGD
ncbi:unnamed protein product [Sympodiomycopsis kandeliae]